MNSQQAKREAFQIVPETCRAVEYALTLATESVTNILNDALADAEKEIKSQTEALRTALIDALDRAITAEDKVKDLENLVERLQSDVDDLKSDIRDLENQLTQ